MEFDLADFSNTNKAQKSLAEIRRDSYTEGFIKGKDEGRAGAIEEVKDKKDEIIRWLIKRDKEGYGTTNGELLDHILEIAEQLKEQK